MTHIVFVASYFSKMLDWIFLYVIPHCSMCRPSDYTVSENASIEPRTVATLALTDRRSNHSARSHPVYMLQVGRNSDIYVTMVSYTHQVQYFSHLVILFIYLIEIMDHFYFCRLPPRDGSLPWSLPLLKQGRSSI